MRFLSVAVALVMLFSVGAMAQESGAFDVSGGVYLGNHTYSYSDSDKFKSNALGFYASADASIPGLPVAITGSFATFSPDKSDEGEDFPFKKGTVTVFDLLVGYRVFGELAVGAGWASYGFKDKGVGEDEFDWSNGGFAIGAFGKLPLSDGFQASGKLLFVPSSKLKVKDSDNDGSDTKSDTNMFGFTVSATYAVNDNFGIEGGYRSLRINFKDHDDVDITTGGFFLGVSYAF